MLMKDRNHENHMDQLKETCKMSWQQIRPKYKNTWTSKRKMWIFSKVSLFFKYTRTSNAKHKNTIFINKSVKKGYAVTKQDSN